jgi:hypothetical protein
LARYYFDIQNRAQVVPDDEGTEFDSLDAAVHGAARSAAEIGTDRLVKGDTSDVVIEVRDEGGQRVCTAVLHGSVRGHTEPTLSLCLSDADGLRASKLKHAVQGSNGDGHLRRATAVRS